MFNLVETITADNLILHGLFAEGAKDKPVILHIHGFEGDFFSNGFIPTLHTSLQKQNISFLSVQTRGIGNEYFIKNTKGEWKKYGAHFELLEDAHKDIDGWITFLVKKGFTNIILQGHSLGTMKVLRYMYEGKNIDKIKKLILLAPFDIFKLLENATRGKWRDYYKIAENKVTEGKGEEVIPKEFLDVSMSYQTYISHHAYTDVQKMFGFHDKDYTFPLLQKVNLPLKVIVGSNDEFFHPTNLSHPEEAIEIMKKYIKNFSSKIIEGSGHGYDGYEIIVSDEVVSFIDMV